MGDDVLLNKAEIIERCIRRVHEIFTGNSNNLKNDQTRQDAILLNIERACQGAIDAAMRMVKLKNLGIPKESRDAFEFLEKAKIITPELSQSLKKMVGFRNIAVHDYQKMNLDIVEALIRSDFPELREFVRLATKW
jgi:uncharacterized protein YutE (UPF0331/DUF86 family)